ncbi:MAG: aminotransferase class V-fold PLP-dependent enzyme [Pseudomonadota bacterium]
MVNETAAFVRPIFSAPPDAAVLFAASGSESNLLALKGARDATARREVVMAASAHPCLDKAAAVLGLTVVRTAVSDGGRADVQAMIEATGPQTAAVVLSMPCDSRGVCDMVAPVAEAAQRAGSWCHVDACLGGYLVPFLKAIGRQLPDFDFGVPGVRSISADLHKYGYAPTGISSLLLRKRSDEEVIGFAFDGWNGSPYASATMAGTRSVAPLAGAWATLLQLGQEGLSERAAAVADWTDRLAGMVRADTDLQLLSCAEAGMVHFSPLGDCSGFGTAMARLGLRGNATTDPDGFTTTVGPYWDDEEMAQLLDAARSIAASSRAV